MLHQLYEKHEIEPAWLAFRSQGYPGGNPSEDALAQYAAIAELPPLLRTLLVTDGTVTRSLEAYFWEPIAVQQRSLSTALAAKELPWLGSAPEDELLFREVHLVGEHSGTIYASAYSVIRLEFVPTEIQKPLRNGGIGIGVLLRQSGIESYRELLDVSFSDNLEFDDDSSNCSQSPQPDIVSRTYRIMVQQRPLMLITEKFPKHIYR